MFGNAFFFASSQNWTPALIMPGLWADAQDSSTLTLVGSKVSQWNDKSGNGRHLSNANAATQPYYSATALNGMPAVYSDISLGSQIIQAVYNNYDFNSGTVAVVVDFGPAVQDYEMVYQITSASGKFMYTRRNVAADSFEFLGISSPTGTATGTKVMVNSRSAANGRRLFLNGFLSVSNATDTLNGPVENGTVSLFGPSNFSSLFIREIVVATGELNTSDREKLEGYLAWKWGLVANLPSNHPYRWDGSLFGYGTKLWSLANTSTALWLDSADPSTLTLVGSNVSQFRDKSTNNRHFNQGTSAAQPVYNTSFIAEKPVLAFNGTSRFMSAGDTLDFLTNNLTIFAVVRFNTSNQSGTIIGKTRFAAASGRYALVRVLTGSVFGTGTQYSAFLAQPSSTVAYTEVLDSSTSPKIISAELNRALSGGYSRIRDNTVITTSISYAGDTVSANTTDELWIGAYQGATGTTPPTASSYLNGNIAEIVVITSILTDQDRQRIEGYLAHKWALTASLPSDHPYKTNPPTV